MKTQNYDFLKLLFVLLMIISSASCSDSNDSVADDNSRNSLDNQKTYLTFSSQFELDVLINQLKYKELESDNSSDIIKTYTAINPNFVSLKNRLNQIKKKTIITNSGDDEADDVEGVTAEEFFFQLKIDTLLSEDFMENVLNEDLMIGVANKVYKITEFGTFIADKSSESKLDEVIANFDKNKVTALGNGLYNVTEGIDIQDSYSYIAGVPDLESEETEEFVVPKIGTYAYSFSDYPEANSKAYNINTYGWKSKTFLGKVWGSIFGKQPIRGNNFDKKHRVTCELYQVNYFFYKSAGFKVWMQHRKRFLGVKYWKKSTSGVQDLVIGFEEFSGTFEVPTPWNNIRQADREFQTNINNIGYNYIYGYVQRIDFIHDWTNSSIIIATQKKLEKRAAKIFMSQITNRVLEPLKGQSINIQTPKTIYSGFDSGTKKVYLQGFKNYGSGSKSIRFSRAGGFTIIPSNSWVPKPLQVERFSLESASIFGAIKYNNQWRGVRFKVD